MKLGWGNTNLHKLWFLNFFINLHVPLQPFLICLLGFHDFFTLSILDRATLRLFLCRISIAHITYSRHIHQYSKTSEVVRGALNKCTVCCCHRNTISWESSTLVGHTMYICMQQTCNILTIVTCQCKAFTYFEKLKNSQRGLNWVSFTAYKNEVNSCPCKTSLCSTDIM